MIFLPIKSGLNSFQCLTPNERIHPSACSWEGHFHNSIMGNVCPCHWCVFSGIFHRRSRDIGLRIRRIDRSWDLCAVLKATEMALLLKSWQTMPVQLHALQNSRALSPILPVSNFYSFPLLALLSHLLQQLLLRLLHPFFTNFARLFMTSRVFSLISGCRKVFASPLCGHKQRLWRRETVIIGLLIDFDVDQRILRNPRSKNPGLRGQLTVRHSKYR
jgi:hypothetical protein